MTNERTRHTHKLRAKHEDVSSRTRRSFLWSRQAYPSLYYFHENGKGGHFAAWEQPELFAEEIRAAFRSVR